MTGLAVTPTVASAAPSVALNQAWSVSLPGETVRESSPVMTSFGVAFGTFAGNIHVLNLASGAEAAGWPVHGTHPINGTPAAITMAGQSTDTLFVGTGEAATSIAGACSGGGLWALNASGGTLWQKNLTDPNCSSLPFQSSFTLGSLTAGGGVSGSIGSLGLLFFSINAATGAVNAGFPYYANDAQFSTPALTTINGAPALVEGIDSFSTNGGAIVALDGSGHVIWKYPTREVIHSSPAIGVDADGSPYVAVGAGDYYATHGGSPDSDTLFNLDLTGHLRWRQDLDGITLASPALADVTGSGAASIVEATDGFGGDPNKGSLSVLDPVTGNFLPGWKEVPVPGGAVIGGPTTADFGTGYQDILVPTGGGIDVFDGKSAQVVATLDPGLVSFQNSPLVVTGPSGFATGVVTVGTQPNGTGVAQYYTVGVSPAAGVAPSVGWSTFHHDPQHTGSTVAAVPPVAACTPGAAATPPSGKVVRLAGATRDATAIDISASSFPTAGSARAVVVASDANYPDALAGGPLAVAKHGPLLITPQSGLAAPVMAEISRVLPAGATVYVLGGAGAVSSSVDGALATAGYHVTRLAGADRFATAVADRGRARRPDDGVRGDRPGLPGRPGRRPGRGRGGRSDPAHQRVAAVGGHRGIPLGPRRHRLCGRGAGGRRGPARDVDRRRGSGHDRARRGAAVLPDPDADRVRGGRGVPRRAERGTVGRRGRSAPARAAVRRAPRGRVVVCVVGQGHGGRRRTVRRHERGRRRRPDRARRARWVDPQPTPIGRAAGAAPPAP